MRRAASLLLLLLSSATAGADGAEVRSTVANGVSVEVTLKPAGGESVPGRLREGADAEVRFRLRDAATGSPLAGLRPAAWLDVRGAGEGPAEPVDCRAKVQSFLGPGLGARAVVDLNSYHVLVLNDDASISVIDPLFGFGGTKLVTTVLLDGAGTDWALSADGRRLYVTVPSKGHVAVVDTASWKVSARVAAGRSPGRVALQPDGRYLWVGDDSGEGGVTVVDTESAVVAARIPTARGRHEFAFGADSRFAFVLAAGPAGALSIVDVRTLKPVREVKTGDGPSDVAYSGLADAVYVTHDGDGSVAVVDGRRHEVVARVAGPPGLRRIRFAPGGRWGIGLNALRSEVVVLDASSNQVVHTVASGRDPDQVSFTSTAVFVRSTGTESVTVLPMSGLGKAAPLATSEFPAGQEAPRGAGSAARGAAIVPAPEGASVLVASPADKMVYYYAEGMAAPMGSFRNYGRQARAVLVADRGLREVAPGTYETSLRLPAAGKYDLALLVNAPRVSECFAVGVEADPGRGRKGVAAFRIEPLRPDAPLPVGKESVLSFRVTDAVTGEPAPALADLEVQLTVSPGGWRVLVPARPSGDGIFDATVTLPRAGAYFASFRSKTLGARFHELPPVILRAGLTPSAAPGGTP